MKNYKRATLFHVSRHQKKFFYPVVAAFALGCMTSWLTLIYFLIGTYLIDPAFDRLHNLIPYLLLLTALAMFGVLFWVFRLSSRYLGAYERLISDLDDMIKGESKGDLSAREGDIMFKELLERVNTLIRKK